MDCRYLKKGDKVDVKYCTILLKNLEVTHVGEECFIVGLMFAFNRVSGEPCNPTEKGIITLKIGEDM